jgi:hypothetical protein
VKRGAFCAGLGALLGDLLALVIHGGRLAFVITHDDQVLVRAEARALAPVVDRLLIVLVAGRETVDPLESLDVVHREVELTRLAVHPLELRNGTERDLDCGCSRHVFSSELTYASTMLAFFSSSNDKYQYIILLKFVK